MKTSKFSWKKEHLKLWTKRVWLLEGLKLPRKAVAVHWDRRRCLEAVSGVRKALPFGSSRIYSYKCPLKTFP